MAVFGTNLFRWIKLVTGCENTSFHKFPKRVSPIDEKLKFVFVHKNLFRHYRFGVETERRACGFGVRVVHGGRTTRRFKTNGKRNRYLKARVPVVCSGRFPLGVRVVRNTKEIPRYRRRLTVPEFYSVNIVEFVRSKGVRRPSSAPVRSHHGSERNR